MWTLAVIVLILLIALIVPLIVPLIKRWIMRSKARTNARSKERAKERSKERDTLQNQLLPLLVEPCGPVGPRIFVSIASYRDPECIMTVRRLLERACHPEQLDIVVLEQNEPSDVSLAGSGLPIKLLQMPASQARGPLYARALIQQHAQNQLYLQLDSHVWPRQGWDSMLLRQLESCPNPYKTYLTAYPNNYDRNNPDGPKDERPTRLIAKRWAPNGALELEGKIEEITAMPFPSLFCSGCLLFGPMPPVWPQEMTEDLFFGEEIFTAARLWTHGYDLYSPSRQIMFHIWDRGYRPTFWEHQTKDRRSNASRRWKDLEQILQGGPDQGLLGKARSLESYQIYCDVDFRQKKIGDRARQGV